MKQERFSVERDFSLSAMFTRESRLDTLNLHIHLGKMQGLAKQDEALKELIKLREARYLI